MTIYKHQDCWRCKGSGYVKRRRADLHPATNVAHVPEYQAAMWSRVPLPAIVSFPCSECGSATRRGRGYHEWRRGESLTPLVGTR